MAEQDGTNSETSTRGAQASLVESFTVSGLYGYRSVSLSSPYAATVLIARNGSGKTTLLGALDAFLKGQFGRLRELEFSEIRCKLRGIDEEITLCRDDIPAMLDSLPDSDISHYAKKIGVEPTSLYSFLSEEYDVARNDYRYWHEEPVIAAAYKNSGWRANETIAVLDKLRDSMFSTNSKIPSILSTLRTALKGVDILYLPTYRRVELPLMSDTKEGVYGRKRRPKFRFSGSASLFTGDIQFGLGDIADRLSELNQEILVESNNGYRQISANIINELIDGTFDRETFDNTDMPTKADLEIFFSRIKEGRRVAPFGDVAIPNIDKAFSGGDIPVETNKFLRYFLTKLGKIIKDIHNIEAPVEDFIKSCNKYLASQDVSAVPPCKPSDVPQRSSTDNKLLQLNRMNLQVYAVSLPSRRKIFLDSLSSGEKQMISLFAKLFLYPKEKIVLIDEPELSLSLDWQRQILVDVVNAPLCRQVIAITHSPFVFDNALEPFARSLKLSVDDAAQPPVSDDDEGNISE